MNRYIVYDKNENYVTTGTAKVIAKLLETSAKTVRDYARKNYLINKKYRVFKVEDNDGSN